MQPFMYGYPLGKGIPKPDNFDKMKECAEILAQGFDYVRVDLYSVNNNVVFGELTFAPGAGWTKFSPSSYDHTLGDMWQLKR
jgi:hypothetical protein